MHEKDLELIRTNWKALEVKLEPFKRVPTHQHWCQVVTESFCPKSSSGAESSQSYLFQGLQLFSFE